MNLEEYLKREEPQRYYIYKKNKWGTEDLTLFEQYFLRWSVAHVEIVREYTASGMTYEVHNIYIRDWE